MRLKRPLLPLSLGLFLLLADLLTKWWVSIYLPLMNASSRYYPYGGIGIFQDFFGIEFSLVHQINRGMAWGLFGEYQLLLVGFRILLITCLVIYLIFYNRHSSWNIPISLVITGALGNIVGTFIYGHVIDFFYFEFWGYSYPVFNLADSFIFIGIFWLFFAMLFTEKQKTS